MTREEALIKIQLPPYEAAQLKMDKSFVLKKLGLTEAAFEEMMRQPVRAHIEFDCEGSFFSHYPVFKPLRPLWTQAKKKVRNISVFSLSVKYAVQVQAWFNICEPAAIACCV